MIEPNPAPGCGAFCEIKAVKTHVDNMLLKQLMGWSAAAGENNRNRKIGLIKVSSRRQSF